jgi:hypothetical protein
MTLTRRTIPTEHRVDRLRLIVHSLISNVLKFDQTSAAGFLGWPKPA